MMNVDDWIKRLKHLVFNRNTYYSNRFPDNCGYIHSGAVESYDCIGLVKSVINEPDIVYKTSPVGYYVRPAQVIPDTTEIGILNLCTDVSYDFNHITAGEYLYYAGGGHAGVYVGSFQDGGECNVIECTPAFGNGVTTSWVDGSGRRFNHRGGYQVGRWGAHGKLSRYIDYGKPQPQPTPSGKISVDGEWGSSTTKLAQKIFNSEIDGEVSNQDSDCRKYCLNCVPKGLSFGSWVWNDSKGYSPLIQKIQIWCGMDRKDQDGKFGYNSIKAFQKKLGVGVDGYCGYETVSAFQKWLNSQVK